MIKLMIKLIALASAAALLVFTLRRLLFTLAIFLPRRKEADNQKNSPASAYLPSILILIPCRDEERMIPGLCESIDRLDYPSEKYQVVLIDDASRDSTAARMEHCARQRPNWSVIALHDNVGKAAALNYGIEHIPYGEIIYVLDADHRPEPDVLKVVSRYFADPKVAGVGGNTEPLNPLASPSAYYSAMENYLHRLVTMRAKDNLGLAPVLMGSNCGYRREALEKCHGFKNGAFLEDLDLTIKFYEAGYQIRFVEDATAYHQVPETVRGYLDQHIRWARGFGDVSKDQMPSLLASKEVPVKLRVELLLFSSGYLDRMAMVVATILTGLSFLNARMFSFPRQILSLALVTPMVQIIAFLIKEKMPVPMWLRLPWIPVYYLLDIYASFRGICDSLMNRPRKWRQTERARGNSYAWKKE